MVAFVWSPVLFFEARLHRPPAWLLALSAPLLCGVLDMSAVLVLASKHADVLEHLASAAGVNPSAFGAARVSSVLSLAGYPMYFVLMALIVASVDTLMLDSGRQVRLVELVGLAFFSFLPVCALTLVVALTWTPPPFHVTPGASFVDVQPAMASYLERVQADPALSTMRALYYASLAWCVALTGGALKVTTGLSSSAAAVTALLMFAGFSGFWR